MSDHSAPTFQPISDRSRRSILSESDAWNVERGVITWSEAMAEREQRIQSEMRQLRHANARLSERLADAERAHTVWLVGLAVVTLAALIVALSIIR